MKRGKGKKNGKVDFLHVTVPRGWEKSMNAASGIRRIQWRIQHQPEERRGMAAPQTHPKYDTVSDWKTEIRNQHVRSDSCVA